MINKVYEKIKEIIKKNYLYFIVYITAIIAITYPLPYYIYNGGGIINVDNRIKIENSYKSKGSFNLSYVSELKATLPTYLLAQILPDWDIIKMEEMTLNEEESDEDIYTRDRFFLEDANKNAIQIAYQRAGKTFNITEKKNYIIYIDSQAKTNAKIGDQLLKVDNQSITNISDLTLYIAQKKIGEELQLLVKRKNKKVTCYAQILEIDNSKKIGFSFQENYEYETNPNVELTFSKNESGPSGGLLLSLAIYNHLVEEDITQGLKIAGTGTIDQNGNVGSIGGVKYKLKGAVKNNADIFLVPSGENYQEAIALQQQHKYKIKIIGVSTFEEALQELQKMSK